MTTIRYIQSLSLSHSFIAADAPLRLARHHILVDRILFGITGNDIQPPTWDETHGLTPRPVYCCHFLSRNIMSSSPSLATEVVFQHVYQRVQFPWCVQVEQYQNANLTLPTHIAILVTVSMNVPSAIIMQPLPLSTLFIQSCIRLRLFSSIELEAFARHSADVDDDEQDCTTILPSRALHTEPTVRQMQTLIQSAHTWRAVPTVHHISTPLYAHQLQSIAHLRELYDHGVTYKTQPPGTLMLRPERAANSDVALIIDCVTNTLRSDSCLTHTCIRGGILTDAPNTGKTLTMLGLCVSRRSNLPTLILCASHLLQHWQAQIRLHLAGTYHVVLLGTYYDWTCLTYDDIRTSDFVVVSFAFMENRKVLRESLASHWNGAHFLQDSIERRRRELIADGTKPFLYHFRFEHMIVDEFTEFSTTFHLRILKSLRAHATWLITNRLHTACRHSQTVYHILHRCDIENTANRVKTMYRHTVCSKDSVQLVARYRWIWYQLTTRERLYYESQSTDAARQHALRTAHLTNHALRRPHSASNVDEMFRFAKKMAIHNPQLLAYLDQYTGDDIECPICMTSSESLTMFLKCGHVACDACTTRWLTSNDKCIVCRTPIRNYEDVVVVGEYDDSIASKLGSKLAKVLDVLEQYNHKMVVYTPHEWELQILARALRQCQIKVSMCCGNINQRERNLRLFREDPLTRLLLLCKRRNANGLLLNASTIVLLDVAHDDLEVQNVLARCAQPLNLVQFVLSQA